MPDQDYQGSLRCAALASSRPCVVRSFRFVSGCSIRHPRSPRDRRAAHQSGLIGITSAALLPVARCSVPSPRLVCQCSVPRSASAVWPPGRFCLRLARSLVPAADACRIGSSGCCLPRDPPSLRLLPTFQPAFRVSARGTASAPSGSFPSQSVRSLPLALSSPD